MKDAYSCDRDEAGLERELPGPVRRLHADVRAARAEDHRGRCRRRDHGRQPCPRVHGPEPGRRGRARPVRVVRLRGQPPDRRDSARDAHGRKSPCRSRRSRRPGRRRSPRWLRSSTSPRPGPPRRRSSSPATAASSPRSSAATTTSTRRSCRTRSAPARASGPRPSRRSGPRAWSPATARRSGRGTRRSSSTSSSRVRRTSSPAPTGRASTTATSTCGRDFTRGSRRRHHERPGGRSLPDLRLAREPAQRDRGRQHLQARDEVHRRGRRARTSARTASEHPIIMGSYGIGVGRNVACVVEDHHDDKGIIWPEEVAPYAAHLVAIGANEGPAGHRGRGAPPRRRARAPATGATSSTTTATSRPASSSPTPSCSGCRGS